MTIRLLTSTSAKLQTWGYVLGTFFLPWDGGTRSLGTGKSIEELIRAKGFKVRVNRQLSVTDGINAVRTLFPQIYADAKCFARTASVSQALSVGTANSPRRPKVTAPA
jgi:phage terminase large subunit